MLNPRTFPQKVFDTLLRIDSDVMNDGRTANMSYDDMPLDVALKKCTSKIKSEALDESTGRVDYAGIKESKSYQEYRDLTAHLHSYDLGQLDTQEKKLAFWLNLYNALIIDGIIHYNLQGKISSDLGFFRRIAYNMGGYRFSADDIEHGILRANAGHPYLPGPQFGMNDKRRQFALENIDIRIHFALVCGATSCPPINFYCAEKIDVQLEVATKNFLSQDVQIYPEANAVTMSKILQWYGEDFGCSRWVKFGFGDMKPLLDAVASYVTIPEHISKVRFRSYDWSVNGGH